MCSQREAPQKITCVLGDFKLPFPKHLSAEPPVLQKHSLICSRAWRVPILRTMPHLSTSVKVHLAPEITETKQQFPFYGHSLSTFLLLLGIRSYKTNCFGLPSWPVSKCNIFKYKAMHSIILKTWYCQKYVCVCIHTEVKMNKNWARHTSTCL